MIVITFEQFRGLSPAAQAEIMALKPDPTFLGLSLEREGPSAEGPRASTSTPEKFRWKAERVREALEGLSLETIHRLCAVLDAGESATRAEIEQCLTKVLKESGIQGDSGVFSWRGFTTAISRRLNAVSGLQGGYLRWMEAAGDRTQDRLHIPPNLRKGLSEGLYLYSPKFDFRAIALQLSPTAPKISSPRERGAGAGGGTESKGAGDGGGTESKGAGDGGGVGGEDEESQASTFLDLRPGTSFSQWQQH